jgi:hypothetical protein
MREPGFLWGLQHDKQETKNGKGVKIAEDNIMKGRGSQGATSPLYSNNATREVGCHYKIPYFILVGILRMGCRKATHPLYSSNN